MSFNSQSKEDVAKLKDIVINEKGIKVDGYIDRVLAISNDLFNENIGKEAMRSRLKKYIKPLIKDEGVKTIKQSKKVFNDDGSISLIEVISLTKEQKDSPEAVIKALGYNPDNFKARGLTLNVWQQHSTKDGTVDLYQVKVTLEPAIKKISMDEMVEMFEKKIKTIKPLKLPKQKIDKSINNDLVMESPAKELHHGKKYLNGITSEERLFKILEDTIQLQSEKQCGTLYDGFGSDLFNSEANQMTTGGTPMDNLMSYEEMFDSLIDMHIKYYTELRKHFKRIDVNLIRGNHDFNISFAAYRLLSQYFKNDDVLHFNDSYKMTQVYEFGNCAIFSNHGDFSNGKPLQRFLGGLVNQHHNVLGRTKHWKARLYHLHSLYAFDDVTGIECTRLQAPTGIDQWHEKNNYFSESKFPIFIWDKEYGEIDRHYVYFDTSKKKLNKAKTLTKR